MITERDLRTIAGRYVEGIMHPNQIVCSYLCILDALTRGLPLWIAVYYDYGLEIGLNQEDCEDIVNGITTEKDVVVDFKSALDEYCKHGWEYKLEQLAALQSNTTTKHT